MFVSQVRGHSDSGRQFVGWAEFLIARTTGLPCQDQGLRFQARKEGMGEVRGGVERSFRLPGSCSSPGRAETKRWRGCLQWGKSAACTTKRTLWTRSWSRPSKRRPTRPCDVSFGTGQRDSIDCAIPFDSSEVEFCWWVPHGGSAPHPLLRRAGKHEFSPRVSEYKSEQLKL